MKLCSITPHDGGLELRVYEVDHATRSRSAALKSFEEICPSVFSMIGMRHLCGTPRWRHFLREASLTPSRSAALSISDQSSVVIPSMDRDDLSPSQETTWGPEAVDNLSYYGGMSADEEDLADSKYLEDLLALTKALRKAKGPKWTQRKMADQIGTTLAKYKKYEIRSPMPHRLILRFCAVVGVETDDYLGLSARVKPALRLIEQEQEAKKKPKAKRGR